MSDIYEDDHLYEEWREDIGVLGKRKAYERELMLHPSCRDPDHPGCEDCREGD